MVVIAGIDLAWSGRKPTGVCLLEVEDLSSRVVDISVTPPDTDAEAVLHLLAALGPDVVAGIDAPLIVGPNRRAEAELARAYGRFGVFAYAARIDFLDRHRIGEGPRLGALLAASGWDLSPAGIAAEASGRRALEVFPHATAVSLLGAAFALKYKKGSAR
jgi:predicted RNase H-like nuclease